MVSTLIDRQSTVYTVTEVSVSTKSCRLISVGSVGRFVNTYCIILIAHFPLPWQYTGSDKVRKVTFSVIAAMLNVVTQKIAS